MINFIHANWPNLMKRNFVEEFITPIVKATKGKDEISFFSIPEYIEWRQNTDNWKSWKIKYYKGTCSVRTLYPTIYCSSRSGHLDVEGGEGVLLGHGPSSHQVQVRG